MSTFLNASGASLHSHQVIHLHFLTSGLCCSAGLWRRILIGWAQSSPITAPLWLRRRELLVEGTLWSEAVFHTPHGAQWVPALSRLCDCCPEGQCSLFLPGPACCSVSIARALTWSPGHSKALQSPSVGSVLWSTFAEEIKVIGKEGGRESSTRLVLESSPRSN